MELLTQNPISAARIVSDINHSECGALVTFDGIVRNHHAGKQVLRLEYEAYEPMAIKVLCAIKDEIMSEWPMSHVELQHRFGRLEIGDVAVAIAVWTPHRKEAFLACHEAIDRIKRRVPIWKHEFYSDGTDAWVRCHHE